MCSVQCAVCSVQHLSGMCAVYSVHQPANPPRSKPVNGSSSYTLDPSSITMDSFSNLRFARTPQWAPCGGFFVAVGKGEAPAVLVAALVVGTWTCMGSKCKIEHEYTTSTVLIVMWRISD